MCTGKYRRVTWGRQRECVLKARAVIHDAALEEARESARLPRPIERLRLIGAQLIDHEHDGKPAGAAATRLSIRGMGDHRGYGDRCSRNGSQNHFSQWTDS